ncbi:MAG: hypothetical protein K0R34_1277 [Herbinix sp.]|jgi:hypothetical protein|nr:hypothetical protein [Herbinix sp.]
MIKIKTEYVDDVQKLAVGIETNIIYEFAKNCIIPINEKYPDSGDDTIKLVYNFKNEQRALIVREYKPDNIQDEGCKRADILSFVFDDKRNKCLTYILDMKRNITGFDDSENIDSLRKGVISRIKDFIYQLEDTRLTKNSLIAYYEGYEQIEFFGIITRSFKENRIDILINKLKDILNINTNINKLLIAKVSITRLSIEKEIDMLEMFKNKQIILSNKKYELHVILLEKCTSSSNYFCDLHINI